MTLFKILCAFVLYTSGIECAKKCSDCVSISSCEGALSVVTSLQNGDRRALYRIQNAICSFKDFDAQVCCSHFAAIEDPIENHPNVGLLPENCGKISSDHIIGSTTAKLYMFPWMALIPLGTSNGLQFCSGTVINSRYILTAGHCVYAREKVAGVPLEEFNITTQFDCSEYMDNLVCETDIQDVRVEKVIIHESFNNTMASQHDIALLRLDRPIDFSQKNAAPICLPLSKNQRGVILEGKNATVVGWSSMEGRPLAKRLWKVEVLVKPDGDCPMANPNTTKVFCADNAQTCRKDNGGNGGGPLMVEVTQKGITRYIQYGIVYYGSTNCRISEIEVYTDLTKFVGWILNNIEE